MMGSSFWGHLELTLRGAATEPMNTVVLLFKLALWGTCALSLVRSFLHASRTLTPPRGISA